MAYKILFKEPAKKQIDRLDWSIRERIFNALKRLSEHPSLGKPLQGNLAGYRSYRIGDFRIVFEIHEKVLMVIVVAVGHRREIYEALKQILKRIGP